MEETVKSKCSDRVQKHLTSRVEAIKDMLDRRAYEELRDYGLDFSKVDPYTFPDQKYAYYRYQISWGGPSEEFRYYLYRGKVKEIEFWLLDWFDGACIKLNFGDYGYKEAIDIFNFFKRTL